MQTSSNRLHIIKLVLLTIATAVFIIAVPLITTGYSMMVMNVAIINFIAALGLSIMLGMGGLLSFATVSMMGIGAYFTANLTSGRLGFAIPTLPGLIISVLATGVAALIIGAILLRIKGTYFTFATIGLVQVTWQIYLNYKPLCGGPDGISSIPTLNFLGFTPADYRQWFYLLMGFAIAVGLIVERIRTTSLGRSLASVRDNEIAANTLGVNVYLTKVWAFTIAGMLAGLAGSLYAMHAKFISADIFTFDISTTYVIMVMLGGVTSTPGVFIGAVLVMMLPEWLRSVERYLKLFYGIGVILLMMFMPMGLAGMVNLVLRRRFGPRRNDGDESGKGMVNAADS